MSIWKSAQQFKEMQIKTTIIPISMATIKTKKPGNNKCRQECGEIRTLCTGDGSEKWCVFYGKHIKELTMAVP